MYTVMEIEVGKNNNPTLRWYHTQPECIGITYNFFYSFLTYKITIAVCPISTVAVVLVKFVPIT